MFWLAGIGGCTFAKTSIHEIQAYLLFVIGTLAICGGAIVEAIDRSTRATGAVIDGNFKELGKYLTERDRNA